MRGCLSDGELLDFLEGRLDPESLRAAEAHLASCTSCSGLAGLTARAVLDDPATARQPAVGQHLGRYVLLRHLGTGGMGSVHLAWDSQLDRNVALKLLRPGLPDSELLRSRLHREAQAMARLSHPNVITVFDVGAAEERIFVAMEYVAGGSLRAWLRARPRTAREVIALFLQAGEGLAAAHAAGIVHRDFKPDNVLVRSDGRACVTDFGLARVGPSAAGEAAPLEAPVEGAAVKPLAGLERSAAGPAAGAGRTAGAVESLAGMQIGSLGYMPLEQLRGGAADERSDLFSFCVALWEALGGDRPFAGETPAQLESAIARGEVRPPGRKLPARLGRALLAGLRPEPSARPAGLGPILAELRRDPRVVRRRVLLSTAAALLVLAVPIGFGAGAARTRRLCSGAPALLSGVWDEPRRARVQAAFHASPLPVAGEALGAAERALDAWAAAFASQHREACEATRLRGEQSEALLDARMACLATRLGEARALVDVLSEPSAEAVRTGAAAVQALPPLSLCVRSAGLREKEPEPPDAREQARPAREQLARAMALASLQRFDDAREVGELVEAQARALKNRFLLSEALAEQGYLHFSAWQFARAEAALHEAARLAVELRDDTAAASIWARLGLLAGWGQGHFAEGHLWLDYARAAAARAGQQPELEATIEGDLAQVLLREQRFEESEAAARRTLLFEQRDGEDTVDSVPALQVISRTREARGDHQGALDAEERGLRAIERSLGRNAPVLETSLRGVASLLAAAGRQAERAGIETRRAAISEASRGPRDPETLLAISMQAEALVAAGRVDEALARYREALSRTEGAPALAESRLQFLSGQATALRAAGRPAEGIAGLEQALASSAGLAHVVGRPPVVPMAHLALAESLAASGQPRARVRLQAKAARDGCAEDARSFPGHPWCPRVLEQADALLRASR